MKTNEDIAALHAGRILDLRDCLARETDPERRESLESEIDVERRRLALLLSEEGERKQEGSRSFTVKRDTRYTLTLHWGKRRLPVNPSYLERLVGDFKLAVPPGGAITVSPAIAMDAIDEAMGSVEQTIATAEDLKQELLFYYGIADALSMPSAKACA